MFQKLSPFAGTYGYIAPQVFLKPESSRSLDEWQKHDFWGFGVLAHELVTNQRPKFQVRIAKAFLAGDFDTVSKLRTSELDLELEKMLPELEMIINQTLIVDPVERKERWDQLW